MTQPMMTQTQPQPWMLQVTAGSQPDGTALPLSDGLRASVGQLLTRSAAPHETVPLAEGRSRSAEHVLTLPWGLGTGPQGLALWHQLESLAHAHQVDIALLPAGQSLDDFSVLAMDMDSTVINIECIDELADLAGCKPQVAAITEATMRGEIANFTESLHRRVGLLKGLSDAAIEEILQNRLRLNPGALELVQTAKARGLKTVLVSGGFTQFAQQVAHLAGFDHVRANQLEIHQGRLTGKVLGEVVDGEAKRRTVEAVCQELGVSSRKAITVGDGSNDLPMMGISGMSVAYRAKPAVRAKAHRALTYGRLDALCYGLS